MANPRGVNQYTKGGKSKGAKRKSAPKLKGPKLSAGLPQTSKRRKPVDRFYKGPGRDRRDRFYRGNPR
jgi:hypothetical protein